MKQIKTTSTGLRMLGMKLISIRIGRRQALCLLVAVLIAAAATVMATEALDRNSAADTRSAVTPASSVGKGVLARPQEKLRAERVTAFRHGFEPEEITRTEGEFMLCVDNRAGTEALSLQLTSGTFGPVYAAPIQKGKSGTNELLNLQPGKYILTEASHPGWICTITITPK